MRTITRNSIAAALAAAVLTVATAAPSDAATSIRTVISSTPNGSVVKVGAGTYAFNNFNTVVGLSLAGKAGLSGAGINSTILEMSPHTSTRASVIPTATGASNPLTLLQANGSPTLSNFELLGTAQGHLYNGMQLNGTRNGRVSSVRVKAIPGNNHFPPGETFGINDLASNGNVYSNIEIDGAGVGAAGFGANRSTNLTINNAYFHGNPYSAGITLWASSNVTLTDLTSTNNRTGINMESDSGTITLIRPKLSVAAGSVGHDISIASQVSSAKVRIYDPVLGSTGKLGIRVPTVYGGGPDKQLRSDVHVYINGVDRTSSVVRWYS